MQIPNAICSQFECNEKAVISGLCEAHYLQLVKRKFERELTVEAIQTCMIEGKPPTKDGLAEALQQVKTWWGKAYAALGQGQQDAVFQEETEKVPEWCITIAKGIIEEETAHQENRQPDSFLSFEKRHALEYFKNLESGLTSDGQLRTSNSELG